MYEILDTYQREGLEKIKNSPVLVLAGNRATGKSFLARYHIFQRWMEGKPTLVITKNLEEAKKLEKLLGVYDLTRYCNVIESPATLSPTAIAKIKTLYKEEKISISKKELDFYKLNETKIRNNISQHYSILNSKLIADKTLNDLIIINAFDKRSFENIYFNQILETEKFEFTEEEYRHLKANIKTAFEMKLNDESISADYFYFSKKAYAEQEAKKSWEKISGWIQETRIKTLKAIQYISGFFQEQTMLIFESTWEKMKALLQRIDQCMFDIERFSLKYSGFDPGRSSIFGLDKRHKKIKEEYDLALQKIQLEYNAIIKELNELPFIKNYFPLPPPGETDAQKIYENLDKITKSTPQFEMALKDNIKKQLKSINFRNLKNESLQKLQEELKELFEILNNGYVRQRWEDNAFSLSKLLDFLEKLLSSLNSIAGQKYVFYKNYNWNRFLYSIDEKSLYLISKLDIYNPKNWLIFFKNWYVQNLIQKYKLQLNGNIDEELKKLLHTYEQNFKLSILKTKKIWQNKREILLNKMELKSGPVKRLLLQTQAGAEIQALMDENKDFLTTFLPVTIIPADKLSSTPEALTGLFDYVVYENASQYKKHFPALFPVNKSHNSLVIVDEQDDIPELKKVIINSKPGVHIAQHILQGYHQQGIINLLDMNYTERLYAARNIAHLLQSSNSDITIFNIKNIIIFSAMDNLLNQVFYKILSKYGIKKMRIIDTPFHLLVDNLLEVNNKQILITQNRLLNYKNTGDVVRQLKSLQKISKGGLKIVDFDIRLLLEQPVKNMMNFISKNIIAIQS